jgi:glycosyltransferase involved in cell wall biosynthesis
VRVGLIIYGSLDSISGGYLYDRMLVDHLLQMGDKVEIVSLPGRSYVGSLFDNFSSSLQRRLEQARWDVLLEDELNHPSLLRFNRRLGHTLSHPVVSIVHHLRSCEPWSVWRKRFYRQVERCFLNSVDGFIFNSQTTRSEVENLVGTEKPKLVALPGRDHFRSSITPDQIAKRARQPGPLRILFLGNVIPRKGLHNLLEALSLLAKETWQLVVVGSLDIDPGYTQVIRDQISRRDLARQVKLKGSLPDAQVTEQLAQSHVLAVPSSYEGLGIVYLEGMGFGLPAIASTPGAAGEVISHRQEGFLIDFGDVRALAGSFQMLTQNRELLLKMSLSALRKHNRFPTWKRTTADIRCFVQKLLQR